MMLRISDLQSDSDLDSIRNSCDVFSVEKKKWREAGTSGVDLWFCVKLWGVHVCGAERPDNCIWGVEFAVGEVKLTKTLSCFWLIDIGILKSSN